MSTLLALLAVGVVVYLIYDSRKLDVEVKDMHRRHAAFEEEQRKSKALHQELIQKEIAFRQFDLPRAVDSVIAALGEKKTMMQALQEALPEIPMVRVLQLTNAVKAQQAKGSSETQAVQHVLGEFVITKEHLEQEFRRRAVEGENK